MPDCETPYGVLLMSTVLAAEYRKLKQLHTAAVDDGELAHFSLGCGVTVGKPESSAMHTLPSKSRRQCVTVKA